MSDDVVFSYLTIHLNSDGSSTPKTATIRTTPEAANLFIGDLLADVGATDFVSVTAQNGETLVVSMRLIEVARVTPGELIKAAAEASKAAAEADSLEAL